MKKLMASALLTLTLIHSAPSQAALGAWTGTTPLIGIVFLAGGVGGGIGGAVLWAKKVGKNIGMILPLALGGAVAYLGLVILDGEQSLIFEELDEAAAKKIGLTTEERESFNSELDQVNFLLADVQKNLALIESPTAEDSIKAWSEARELVSPLTFQAMSKITVQAFN